MESWYDTEDDILNIELKEGKYWKSIEAGNSVVIDIAKDGTILGMEILMASKVFSKAKEVIHAAQHTTKLEIQSQK